MTTRDITRIPASSLSFSAVSDLTDCGRHPEDGEPLAGEAWYVQATSPAGHKWRRFVGHYNPRPAIERCMWDFDEADDYAVAELSREQIEVEAHKLAAHLNDRAQVVRSLRLNADRWEYVGAAYGSPAYSAEDEFALLDNDERAAIARGLHAGFTFGALAF